MNNLRDYRLGLILVTASAVAWSTSGLFTRAIGLGSATMLVWRGVFGALGVLAVVLAMQGSAGLFALVRMRKAGWLYAVISAIGMLCFIGALRNTTVAHVAIIYATAPFLAAALAWLTMRERPPLSASLASLAALSGVALMVGLGRESNLLGDLLAFGMTLAMAAVMVIARRYRDIPVLPAAALSALLSAAAATPFSHALNVTGPDLALLAAFGLVNSAVGMALFTLGARLLPAIETALIGALDAPLAPVWVWLWFGETPGRATLIGGAIVFAAVLVHVALQTRTIREPRKAV